MYWWVIIIVGRADHSGMEVVLRKASDEWDLSQWLNSLEHRNVQEIQLGLTRILEVAQKLNLQAFDCKVITVAGTNGKGSTVTALETLYYMAGFKVGAYVSPHLIHFNERIRVDIKPINEEALCFAFSLIEDARAEVMLTYFEMTTLAALWYFKQQNLDVMILEVGLGGRLDATNIINPDVAIITTIDMDHQEFLGFTYDAIGYEKAGILRAGKPFIYADDNPPKSIIDVANNLRATSYLYGKDYFFEDYCDDWDIIGLHQTRYQSLPKPSIQLKSASAAIIACSLLNDYLPVAHEHVHRAMKAITMPGRLQLIMGDINILYDVSHNPQAVALLAKTIKKMNVHGAVHAVFSALKDKDILGLIIPLRDCIDRWYPAQLDNKRGSGGDFLLSKFIDAEIFVDICYNSPGIAFEQALNQAQMGDLIVVYGSFFTVSAVIAYQHKFLDHKEIL